MAYLDMDLEEQRAAPKRAPRASPGKPSRPRPSEGTWRFATAEEPPRATEETLHENLVGLYNSLCSCDWLDVQRYGLACGFAWLDLSPEEYARIRPDYPTAPAHNCYPEEWIGYGTWWLLFWHRELPEALKQVVLKRDPVLKSIPEKTQEEIRMVAARRYGPKEG